MQDGLGAVSERAELAQLGTVTTLLEVQRPRNYGRSVQIDALASLLGLPELPELIDEVDRRVHEALSSSDATLSAAVSRVADAGGKRLRPVMTMAVGHLGSEFDRAAAVAGAAAIELVQVGSLVHDDMFEEAATRRGVPTINAVEGDNVALTAGDFILAKAAEQAAHVGQAFAQRLARTVIELCQGQLREMRDQFNPERHRDDYFASIREKTGVLFAAACAAGASCTNLSPGDADAVDRFGLSFGIAYQLVDDVFDFVADPVRLKKPIGIDMETGVYTLPVILLVERGRLDLTSLLRRHEPDDLIAARQLVLRSGTLQETLALSDVHAADAADAARLLTGPTADGLRAMPRTYFAWAVEHFIPATHGLGDAG